MSRRWILIALATVTAVLGVACGGGDTGGSTTGPSATSAEPQPGGTLHIALISDVQDAFDPQKEYSSVTWEYFRCCLLRTLLSYNGQTTDAGGSELRPDLAADMPVVSDDGLTWTFTLKQGIKYGPPLQDVTVTSKDFVRALEREACGTCNVGGYSFYYSAIKGFDEFAAGDADSISGLETPDDATFVVTLNEPTGDLGNRLAMPASAPIPPLPGDAKERLGAATGHDADWGQFLVATGPYMFEGSDVLDFSKPAKEQDPVAGYSPGRSIVLVRNPSWDASTDELRPAYADRIETTIGGTAEDIALKIDSGDMDLGLDAVPPANQVQQYTTDPDLKDRIHADPSDAVRFLEMNLANPPFDDIHIRKAMNWALDKQGFLQLRGGPIFGDIAGHIMVNSLENNLLLDYDPYATPDGGGDIQKAMEEIKQSKYDADGDGVCDATACTDVLTMSDSADPYPKQLALLQQVIEPLGITLNPKPLERSTMYARCEDPNSRWALCTGTGWGKDYPDGFTFAPPLFSRSAIGPESCCNDTMVGVTPEMLTDRGYDVVDVPSAEDQINACIPLTGDERVQCWADLDTYLMEDVVPWVPYLFDNDVVVLSANVTSYSFDQFAGPARARPHRGRGGLTGHRELGSPRSAGRPRRPQPPASQEVASLWQGADRHGATSGVRIDGRGRRIKSVPPGGDPGPSCGDWKGPGCRRPRATPLSAGSRAFRPVPRRALEAHPLVRLVDQGVRDRAEPERLLLPVLAAPVGGRTEAGVLPERRREVAERVEPHAMADLRDGQLGLAQQVLRAIDPQTDQVAVRRHADVRGELPGEVVGAERGLAGDRPQVHVTIQVLFEEDLHLADAPLQVRARCDTVGQRHATPLSLHKGYAPRAGLVFGILRDSPQD